jgi:hypothetical protein
MSDPLKELLSADALPTTSFPPTSRYSAVPVVTYDPGHGKAAIPHLARRICPQVERFSAQYEIAIVESDRRDTLAARHIGEAELWWRLADANGVIDPRSLTDIAGSRIRVTLAVDIPRGTDD